MPKSSEQGSHEVPLIVGRERELRLLSDAVDSGGPLVVHVHGVSGIGKSALIRAFDTIARNRKRVTCLLDGRVIEPTERGFLQELARGLRIDHPTLAKISRVLSAAPKPVIILLDSYEQLGLLDAWLRQVFMVRLRAHVRLILASRFAPAPQWTESPEWRGDFRAFQLQPLGEPAALEVLASLGANPGLAREVAKFARGHPLALVLGGRAATQFPSAGYRTLHSAISALAQRFLAEVEDPQLREALRAASVARRVTRSLLRALMPELADEAVFDRLSRLPFIESAPDGLMVHDAVREAIRDDLEAIDPKAFQRYRRAAWQQLTYEAKSAGLRDLWRYTADLIFLIRNPVVREAFFPGDVAKFYVEPAGPADASQIQKIVAVHDGEASVRIVERWWRHLARAFYVVRDTPGEVAGFYYLFDPRDAVPTVLESDPVALAWTKRLKTSPLPKGQTALFLRRWLSRDHGEAPSPVQAAAWLDVKRHYMERRPFVQRVNLTLMNVSPYAEAASSLGICLLEGLAITVGESKFQSLELDMGPRSVDGWLARLAAAELGAEQDGLLDERRRALMVRGRTTALTRKEFEVMSYLTLRQGEAVSRIELLNDVWGLKYDSGGNVVDAIIASLRKKLGDLDYVIETVHGHGYLYRNPRLSEAEAVTERH
jgi:DNA-binding winged helix-turn-helix (wHTH) protein